jgi:hypothetical protein
MIVIVLLFFTATLLLFLLPFVPGLREIRARRDAEALPISPDAAVDIRHFAHGFRAFLERELGEPLERVRATGMHRSGMVDGQGDYSVLAAGEPLELFSQEISSRTIDRLLAGVGDLEIPPGFRCALEVYSGGTLRAGAATELRAALADEDIVLERGCRSIRWLHAGRLLSAKTEVVLQGRASAGEAIALATGCTFERIHAPVVRFGDGPPTEFAELPGSNAEGPEWHPDGLRPHHEFAAGRLLVEGDLEIPAGARVGFDLVVWGALTLGAGARVEGSVKSHRTLTLAGGAHVDGSAVSRDDIVLEDRSRVDGPVIAEERLVIGAGCVIGAADEPSTVRAGSIRVRAGTVIHGTVWASGRGEVLP